MFPLPPAEAVVIAEIYRHFPDTREIDMQPTPVLALTRDDRVVPVDDGVHVALWDAA